MLRVMTITIDCTICTARRSIACQDCVVTFLCERDPSAPVVLEASDARALRLFAAAGLAPELRHRPRRVPLRRPARTMSAGPGHR